MAGRPVNPFILKYFTRVDKKDNQFWICTARYAFRDLTANDGDCVKLPVDIGRPSLSETYNARAVTGSTIVSALLPVIWFIEPATGAVHSAPYATRDCAFSSLCPDRIWR